MDRRTFFQSAGAVVATGGTSALAAPAIVQGFREFKMVTTWPRDFPGLGTGAQNVADMITRLSGGLMKIKLFAAGELVPAFEAFDAVARGDAQMYHGADYYWQERHKAYNFFTSVPMGMTALELDAWIRFGGGQQLWDELSAQFGIKPFLAGNTGVQMGGWFQKPIKSLDDIKSLKMRIPGLGGEVVKRLGGEAVTLPGGEIPEALASGRINAAEWVGPYNDRAFGLHKYLQHYMFPGFQEPGTGICLGLNRGFWQSLGDTDRAIFETAATAANNLMLAEYNANNGDALADLRLNEGVQLHIVPQDVWTEIAKTSREVIEEVGNTDDLGRRVLDSFKQFGDRVSEWQRVSDVSYVAYRAITRS
ncbi:MAG: TRAP transporter substrate-binding protein [Hyphomicrobiaceae bacterium]